MTNKRKDRSFKRGKDHLFLQLHHDMIKHSAWGSLSGHAVKLYVELGLKYNGSNNGNLEATINQMKLRGFRSSSTLDKAKKELISKGFIIVTRRGGRNKPTLYALTSFALDDCNKIYDHGVKVDNVATRRWKTLDQNRSLVQCKNS